MHKVKPLIFLAAVAALTACGGDEPTPGQEPALTQPAATSGAAADSGKRLAATAAEVAKEKRGNVVCPAVVSTSPPAGGPVVDIVGVGPGITYEEAANIVMCNNDLLIVSEPIQRGFQIQTYGQMLRQGFHAMLAEDQINKTSKEIMAEMQDRAMARSTNRAMDRDTMRGKITWSVWTMGMPGEERVIGAAREKWFGNGKQPTMDSVGQALIDKYGTPTEDRTSAGGNQAGGYRQLTWAFDPLGRPVTETSPLYGMCTAPNAPGGSVNLSPDCGPAVSAQLTALRENPALVEVMSVGMVDQASGYELVTATEQGFEAMEQSRRAREAEEAAKNAEAPKL